MINATKEQYLASAEAWFADANKARQAGNITDAIRYERLAGHCRMQASAERNLWK